MAVNRRRQVNGKWENASSSFHRCVVWEDQAKRVLDDLCKGSRVVLVGELRTRIYKDKVGTFHTTTTVWVDEIGPSLRFGDAAADHSHGSHHDDVWEEEPF